MADPELERLPVYDRDVLRRLRAWHGRKDRGFGRVFEDASRGLREMVARLPRMPGFDWVVDNVAAGVLKVTNEIAQDSMWSDRILRTYRDAGHMVYARDDVRALDLEHVGTVMEGLATKYGSFTAVQGAAAGAAGLAGIVPDVVGLVALNLRAAGEYAAYAGYDMRRDEERLFALQILHHVIVPSDSAPSPVVMPARAVTQDVAGHHVAQIVVSGSIHGFTRVLGARLARVKLAHLLPVVGIVAGGVFNALYTRRTCEAAFFLTMERRLREKYSGSDLAIMAG